MPKLKDLVWVRPNPSNPNKPFYHTVGCITTTKKGGECVILNLMPIGPDWKGILQAYDPKPKPEPVASTEDVADLEESGDDTPF